MRKVMAFREEAGVGAAGSDVHVSPPDKTSIIAAPPPSGAGCDARKCPWWPYSSSADFKANTALILMVLFFALICALALNAAVRFLLRRHCCGRRRQMAEVEDGEQAEEVPVPAVVYAEGMKLSGGETECIICLSDFAAGERIMVLDKCSHGFHLQCIKRWLAARDSCPTCRARASCSYQLKPTPP